MKVVGAGRTAGAVEHLGLRGALSEGEQGLGGGCGAMSTYVLMKILESTPERYDRGMRILTLGAIDRAYDRLVARVERGQRVLDIGCGTGALALRAARKGAMVTGVDVDAGMLEVARKRARDEGLSQGATFVEKGVAELERDEAGSYDVVTIGLCLSELSEDESRYALAQAHRLLKPEGLLLVADEVVPTAPFARLAHRLIKIPLAVVTWIVAQSGTRALKELPEKVRRSGFAVESTWSNGIGDFVALEARKTR